MVSKQIVHEQLGRLDFKPHGWGQAEVGELPNILLPDEQIYDLVNGFYEGGFALLVATDVRLLLIDKKPLNYLTVEDLRYDQINELDYSHRLMGAYITISSGSKTLKFRSYNQPRLRKVISHVQHCMAELKKKQSSHQEGQNNHLEQINQQLQAYLITQHHQQEQLRLQLQSQPVSAAPPIAVEPVKPPPELADYLYAQSLLAEYRAKNGDLPVSSLPAAPLLTASEAVDPGQMATKQLTELYQEGAQEVYGKYELQQTDEEGQQDSSFSAAVATSALTQQIAGSGKSQTDASYDINPLKVILGKLPMALRNRRFGRPSFHSHSQATKPLIAPE